MKIPIIYATENQLICQFSIGNARHEPIEIKAIRSYVRKMNDSARAENPDREIPAVSVECRNGQIFKGEPDWIVMNHFEFVWEKFSMNEDELLVIEFDFGSETYNYNIEAHHINKALPKEALDIYFVDPNYNFPDN